MPRTTMMIRATVIVSKAVPSLPSGVGGRGRSQAKIPGVTTAETTPIPSRRQMSFQCGKSLVCTAAEDQPGRQGGECGCGEKTNRHGAATVRNADARLWRVRE